MEEAFVGLECPWWSKMQRGSAKGLVGCHWGAGCHWVGGEVSERAIIAISLVGVQPPSWVPAGCTVDFNNTLVLSLGLFGDGAPLSQEPRWNEENADLHS